jgi:O-antigen/teichoic acid export membrane protein
LSYWTFPKQLNSKSATEIPGSVLDELPPLPSSEQSRLDGIFVRSLAWTGSVKWLSQILSWASTLVVARFLTPEDYGLVGMASVYLALVALVNELGLSAAVVTKHELTENQIAQINSLCVFLGVAGFAISCMAAIPISSFFKTPQLFWVVVAMSFSFVVLAFQTVPYSLLQRDLQFKSLALMEGVQVLAQALSMVTLALLGFRYWTLVFGSLLGTALFTGMVLLTRSHSFAWPQPRSIKDALTFSWHILVTRLCWFVQSNSDRLVAGRILGKSALGAYAVGWTLASLPIEKVTGLVCRVTPAFFSAIQKDLAAIRRYLLMLTEGLALLTLPAGWGLALVAEEFVLLALGENWRAAIRPMQILAILNGIRAIDPLLSQILIVVGESQFVMRLSLVVAVTLPTSIYFGSRWGITGIAAAWVATYSLLAIPMYWRVFKRIELPASKYLGVFWPALSGTLVMTSSVLVVKFVIPPACPLWLCLGVEILLGGGAYVLAVVTLHRNRLRSLYQILCTVRS